MKPTVPSAPSVISQLRSARSTVALFSGVGSITNPNGAANFTITQPTVASMPLSVDASSFSTRFSLTAVAAGHNPTSLHHSKFSAPVLLRRRAFERQEPSEDHAGARQTIRGKCLRVLDNPHQGRKGSFWESHDLRDSLRTSFRRPKGNGR